MAIVPVAALEAVLCVTMAVLAFRTCWADSMLLFWLIFFMKTTLNCNKPLSLLMPLVVPPTLSGCLFSLKWAASALFLPHLEFQLS